MSRPWRRCNAKARPWQGRNAARGRGLGADGRGARARPRYGRAPSWPVALVQSAAVSRTERADELLASCRPLVPFRIDCVDPLRDIDPIPSHSVCRGALRCHVPGGRASLAGGMRRAVPVAHHRRHREVLTPLSVPHEAWEWDTAGRSSFFNSLRDLCSFGRACW